MILASVFTPRLAADCPATSNVLPNIYKGLCNSSGQVEINQLTDFLLIVSNLIQIGIALSGAAAVILIVWGGIKYITSQGTPDRTKSAQATIRNAVIGLILASSAYLLVQFFAQGIGG